jgi:hypothetical protein
MRKRMKWIHGTDMRIKYGTDEDKMCPLMIYGGLALP